jgi:hypothetical protein
MFPYTANKVGSHSLRSGAATALHLSGSNTASIMQAGRWSSDAFLTYMRPHLVEAENDIGTRMLQHKNYHQPPHTNNTRHTQDPGRRIDPRAHTSTQRQRRTSFHGPDSSSSMIPRLHLF